MGIIEKTNMWRSVGHVLNTGVGSRVAEATTGLINQVAHIGRSVNLEDEVPFTPVTKPLSESRVALVSTGGFYVDGDQPFDVDKGKGDPTYRVVPTSTKASEIRIAHTHYSHRYVSDDLNVLFPLDRLRELAEEEAFLLSDRAYSFGFGGILTRSYIKPPDGTGHQLARDLKEDEVDLALLVPA